MPKIAGQRRRRYALGINIGANTTRLAMVAYQAGAWQVEYVSKLALAAPGLGDHEAQKDFADAIQHARREMGVPEPPAVVASMWPGRVYYQHLSTDLTREDDVRRFATFELEDDFPVPYDDLLVDICDHRVSADVEDRYLIVGTARSELDALIAAVGPCAAIYADACALLALWRATDNETATGITCILHGEVDITVMLVCVEDCLVAIRRWPGDLGNATTIHRELERTRRALGLSDDEGSIRLLINGDGSLCRQWQEGLVSKTGYRIESWAWAERFAGETPVPPEYAVAVGLAQLQIRPELARGNLIAPGQTARSQRSNAKRASLVLVVLASLLVFLFVFQVVLELRVLKRKDRILESEIADIFQACLPRERNRVRPVDQMREQLKQQRREYQAMADLVEKQARPLKVLDTLTDVLATHRELRFSTLSIEHDLLKIQGIAPSFEVVELATEALRKRPDFTEVTVNDVASRPAERDVQFRMTATRTEGR
ncbi:PilN domain-containing protein [Planctomycetota bacterium]